MPAAVHTAAVMDDLRRYPSITVLPQSPARAIGDPAHAPELDDPPDSAGIPGRRTAATTTWRRALIPLLAAAAGAACTPSSPPDPTLLHLGADLTAMRAFPSVRVSTRCADKLRELSTTRKEILALQQRGKTADPVSLDVLQSDQDEAESFCHPDAVRLCQAPPNPAAAKACRDVMN
jgi:hypothetical protein